MTVQRGSADQISSTLAISSAARVAGSPSIVFSIATATRYRLPSLASNESRTRADDGDESSNNTCHDHSKHKCFIS